MRTLCVGLVLWIPLLVAATSRDITIFAYQELRPCDIILIYIEPHYRKQCPEILPRDCPSVFGCRAVHDSRRPCPVCKCDARYSPPPPRTSCPPLKGCPAEYGCEVRQRVGKCPFCKCGIKKPRKPNEV
ncbi:uncharacterized protein LOC135398264 [Ornithodoros turicata]|uniref:uncharacterized protein LOC135398264 n=1 Tax=Ornithodoros turicata TaxID=34597 RepID=UPI00313A1AC9